MLDPFGGVVHAPEELEAMMAEEAALAEAELRAADAARAQAKAAGAPTPATKVADVRA